MAVVKQSRCVAAAAAGLLLLCGRSAQAALSVQAAPATAAQGYDQLDPIFAEFQQANHIPGLVYGIVADGRLVHVRGFGVQDLTARRSAGPDSLFRIASMTKAFTALSILRLRDEGRLRLDDPVEKHVPELKRWTYLTTDSRRLRIRDLLHHTGGFVTDDPWGDRQTPMPESDFTRLLQAGVRFTRAPGLQMEYSNFGYALLGRVIGNVTGRPYRAYVEQSLLRPLRMNSTGFEVSEWPLDRRAIGYRREDGRWVEEPTMRHGAFGAMGGLQTSANDYARYIAWLLSAWPARDGPDAGPVKRATIRELVEGAGFAEPRKRMVDGQPCEQSVSYGMGMRIFTDCEFRTALNHGGGYPGYGSGVLLLPDHGVGLFVFSNRTYAGGSEALWRAASAMKRSGLLRERPQAVSRVLAEAYAAVKSIYEAGDVLVARELLADNFLLDRSAEGWKRDLADLHKKVGKCDAEASPTSTGFLSGTFRWRCERGTITGSLLLAPTQRVGIQRLQLAAT